MIKNMILGYVRDCSHKDYAYQYGSYWYVDNDRFRRGNLSEKDQLIYFGIGVLTGVVLNEIFD